MAVADTPGHPSALHSGPRTSLNLSRFLPDSPRPLSPLRCAVPLPRSTGALSTLASAVPAATHELRAAGLKNHRSNPRYDTWTRGIAL